MKKQLKLFGRMVLWSAVALGLAIQPLKAADHFEADFLNGFQWLCFYAGTSNNLPTSNSIVLNSSTNMWAFDSRNNSQVVPNYANPNNTNLTVRMWESDVKGIPLKDANNNTNIGVFVMVNFTNLLTVEPGQVYPLGWYTNGIPQYAALTNIVQNPQTNYPVPWCTNVPSTTCIATNDFWVYRSLWATNGFVATNIYDVFHFTLLTTNGVPGVMQTNFPPNFAVASATYRLAMSATVTNGGYTIINAVRLCGWAP